MKPRLSTPVIVTAASLALALSLLAAGTVHHLQRGAQDRWNSQTRRYWEDMYLAIGRHLSGSFPVSYRPWKTEKNETGRTYVETRPVLAALATEAQIRPWEFWRTVPSEPFRRGRRPIPIAKRFDDPGRSLLLSAGFDLLGGVSPFLIFWLGLLAAVPLLLWIAVEFLAARAPVAGATFLLLLGLSPFVADTLALSYSAMAFYLLGLFTLVAFATHACLNPDLSSRGTLKRAALAGVLLGICALCRSSSLLLATGFAVALAVATARAVRTGTARRLTRRLGLLALGMSLVVLPSLILGAGVDWLAQRTASARKVPTSVPPQVHPVWHGIWIGLGDFDRAKGYRWDDFAAFDAAIAAGGTPSTTTSYDTRNEGILRGLILRDIRSDPGWFLTILAKRLAATTLQWKLWPWGPSSGVSMRPASHPSEAHVDSYYSLTRTADRLAIGGWELELPVPALLLPTAVLIGLLVRARRTWRDDPRAGRVGGGLLVMLSTAAAALVHPVLVTTASALETEAFVLVYYLGIAFAAEELWRWRRPPAPAPGL